MDKHTSYTDIVKRLAASNWGKSFDSDDDADRHLLRSMDLSGACLLGIVRRIDNVVNALTHDELKMRAEMLNEEANRVVREFIDPRAEDHGECPRSVVRYLHSQIYERIGHNFLYYGTIVKHLYEPDLPAKGSAARKDYDAWMRRKPRKATDS